MEFVLKGGQGGMIVPAGFSLTFSLTNNSLDYFSVCEIQVTDEPYFQLDTDSLTWKSISISNTSDRIIPRSVIGSDLRCPHLLSDNIYNPELREYYMGYGLGTGRDECSTGFYDLHVELGNVTDIYSVVIWAFRLLNNSQCISTNKSMTVIMRKYISDTGVLCMYSNKTLQHDSLTIMYANCEPIITARFITLRMSKDVFRHDLGNVVEIAVFGYIWQPSNDNIIKLINISIDTNVATLTNSNETKLPDNYDTNISDNNVITLHNNNEIKVSDDNNETRLHDNDNMRTPDNNNTRSPINNEMKLLDNETKLSTNNETDLSNNNEMNLPDNTASILNNNNETLLKYDNTTLLTDKNETKLADNNEKKLLDNETKLPTNNETELSNNNEAKLLNNNEMNLPDNTATILNDNNETLLKYNNTTLCMDKNETKLPDDNEKKLLDNETKLPTNNETKLSNNNKEKLLSNNEMTLPDNTATILNDNNETLLKYTNTTLLTDNNETKLPDNNEKKLLDNETKLPTNNETKLHTKNETELSDNDEIKLLDNEMKLPGNHKTILPDNNETKLPYNNSTTLSGNNEVKLTDNIKTTSHTIITDVDTVTHTTEESAVVTLNEFNSTVSDANQPENSKKSDPFDFRIIVLVLFGIMGCITLVNIIRVHLKHEDNANISICNIIIVPSIDCHTSKVDTLVNARQDGNSSRMNMLSTQQEIH